MSSTQRKSTNIGEWSPEWDMDISDAELMSMVDQMCSEDASHNMNSDSTVNIVEDEATFDDLLEHVLDL